MHDFEQVVNLIPFVQGFQADDFRHEIPQQAARPEAEDVVRGQDGTGRHLLLARRDKT